MTATAISLRLLGTPEILVEGEPLRVDTRKAVAVLACLAVDGRTRRDQLADLLWPQSDRARARGALRRTLSVTNSSLGGLSLDVGGGALELPADSADCDLWTFERLLVRVAEHGDGASCPSCLDDLAQAVGLRRGPFLATFSLRGCPEFEQWQGVNDERLRRRVCEALDQLIQGHAAAGAFEAAATFAAQRLDIEPLHERTHRQLMLLHAWAGRRTEAIRQYRDCVALLNAELGVAPLDETTSLYERLVDGHLPPPPNAPTPSPTPGNVQRQSAPATSAPLVGRDQELRLMVQQLDAADTSGQVISVEGEAGIGKSRLLDELVSHAELQGTTVLTARCNEEERRVPHAPLVELLRAAFSRSPELVVRLPEPVVAEASRLLPELARTRRLPEPAPLEGPEARRHFHESLSEVLAMPAERATLLVVDDAHNADPASLAVLLHLARRLRARTICLVLAWRPEASTADRALRRITTGARDDGWATTIRPQRLSRDEVEAIVSRSAPGDSEELTNRLWAETEGLPLLVVEYLAARTTQPESWGLPVGARDRLLGRLASVRGVPRQVLTTAAVIGRSFDLDLLLQVSGRAVEDVGDALDQLVAGGLLRPVSTPEHGTMRWDFGHAKMRELVHEETSLARRRLLHGRVADAMRSRARLPGEHAAIAALLARHLQLAGRQREAAAQHRLAAQHARSMLAFDESREHLDAALALGDPDVAGVHEQLGDLHTLAGDYVSALANYETAAANLPDLPAARAGIEQKLAGVHLRRGDRVAADAHLGAALHLIADSDALVRRARILADRSLVALRSSDSHEAEALAAEALGLATATKDTAALAQAHNLLAMVARRANRLDEAKAHAKASLELALALGDTESRIAALNNLGLVERSTGRPDEAVILLDEALALCRTSGDRHREAALANNLADALYDAGRRDEAMSNLKDAVSRFADVTDPDVLRAEIWKLVDW